MLDFSLQDNYIITMDTSDQSFIISLDKELAECIIEAVKREEIKVDDVVETARDILFQFQQVKNLDNGILLLNTLKEKYPFLKNLYTKYNASVIQTEEEAVIHKLKQFIQDQK